MLCDTIDTYYFCVIAYMYVIKSMSCNVQQFYFTIAYRFNTWYQFKGILELVPSVKATNKYVIK